MRAIVLVLAACAVACDAVPGDTHGYCDTETVGNVVVTHVPGDYRCAGTQVEVCTAGHDPLRDRPQWVVLQDCSVPVNFKYGSCLLGSDGIARCVYAQTP